MTKSKKTLYRDTKQGKVAGVCVGLAQYFGWETWLVRIIVLSGLFFSGPLFFFAYIAGWIIIEKKPEASTWREKMHPHASAPLEIKSKIWQAGSTPKQAFYEITTTFDELETRLQTLEKHVTSKRFAVAREIGKL